MSLANPTIILWARCWALLLISSLLRLLRRRPSRFPFQNVCLSLCSHLLDLFAPFAHSFFIPFPHILLLLFGLFGLLLLLTFPLILFLLFCLPLPTFAHSFFISFPLISFLLIGLLLPTFLHSQCGCALTTLLQGLAPLPRVHHDAETPLRRGTDTLLFSEITRSKPPDSDYLKRHERGVTQPCSKRASWEEAIDA